MRKDNLNILKSIGIFSLAGCLACILNFYGIQASGEHPLVSPMHGIDIVITILCIIFSVWFFKSYFNGGYLHLWQGIYVGFGVLIATSICYSIFLNIVLGNESNGLLKSYLEALQNNMETNKKTVLENMSAEKYAENMRLMLQSTPGDVVFHDLFQKMMASAFLPIFAALFSALSMRKIDKR